MEVAPSKPEMITNTLNFNLLIDENYEKTLDQSIQNLLDNYQNGLPDLSSFISKFYELMQARVNPPLEAIWVYSALSFNGSFVTEDDIFSRFSSVKNLFQLISACAASCSSNTSISLLAPVVFELHKLIIELLAKDLSLKREKKLMGEIVSLIDVILGYINLCCFKSSNEEDDDSIRSITSFADLVCVWMKGNREGNDGINSFLPLVSKDAHGLLSQRECGVSHLAGVVIVEMFLLRLCLKFHCRIARQELEKELKNCAIGSITGFKNYHFFEILVRVLLETMLPVTSILNSEDEYLLRKVLYDAVILVDYPFLTIGSEIQPPAKRIKSLDVTRLVVAHNAIELFRKKGDQKRAISYINAFSSSCLPSQLIKWVTSQMSMDEKASRPNVSSPTALIKWLVSLEDQGRMTIFDDSFSKCHAKLLVDVSKADYEQVAQEVEGKKSDADLLFYIDNKGEEEDGDDEGREMNESISAAFVAAARTMKLADENGRRKRKDRSSTKKKQIKFLKHNLYGNSDSAKEKFPSTDNDSLSGSEVENPPTDSDVEDKDQ